MGTIDCSGDERMEREAAGDSEEMSWAARRSRRSLQRPSFHVDKPDISVSRNTFSSMDQSSGRDLQLSLVIRGYKSALGYYTLEKEICDVEEEDRIY